MNSARDILIVEDNHVNRELIREILEARGYTVAEAEDGEAAIGMLRAAGTSLAIIDIQMPRISGLELIRLIRDDAALASLRCLALTAFAMSGDREKVLDAGFDAYLTKPFEAQQLLVAIEGLLQTR